MDRCRKPWHWPTGCINSGAIAKELVGLGVGSDATNVDLEYYH